MFHGSVILTLQLSLVPREVVLSFFLGFKFFCLQTAEELGLGKLDIFEDPSYAISNYFTLSTSQVRARQFCVKFTSMILTRPRAYPECYEEANVGH